MKIAVTGALGIVGSGVTAGLREAGHHVIALDRRSEDEATQAAQALAAAVAAATGGAIAPVEASDAAFHELRTVDLTSYEQTREAISDADVVVHLAGLNSPLAAPEWQVHDNNVTASYNLLASAADLGINRVVQASSVNAIGLSWSRSPVFDYFPIDMDHPTRNEDGYSLSKLIQELQADSLTRRHDDLSVVSLRLHAVLEHASHAQAYIDNLGVEWAVKGLFGYCTLESVVSAVTLSCTAKLERHERLWVVEPDTYAQNLSAELAERFYPDVTLREPLSGRRSFFDAERTRVVLGWEPSTIASPPQALVRL